MEVGPALFYSPLITTPAFLPVFTLQAQQGRLFGPLACTKTCAVVADLCAAVVREVRLEPGVSVAYSGQFEYLERANARLQMVVPLTLGMIFVLLVVTFGRIDEPLLIMTTVPFALTGGVWFLHAMGHDLSVAGAVGFIALAGVVAEFGVMMVMYLKQALEQRVRSGVAITPAIVDDAIREGAVMRVRPKAITVFTLLVGLAPVVFGSGTGSELTSRVAAPMLGGMVTAPLLSLFIVPAVYALLRRRG